MERKIGEIFEYNNEWYQCIVGKGCKNCAFNERKCYTFTDNNDPIGDCCSERRTDKYSVIFKKLEKVGEPYEYFIQGMDIIMLQEYVLAGANYIWEYTQGIVVMDCKNGKVAIEIKQNKEDMLPLAKLTPT